MQSRACRVFPALGGLLPLGQIDSGVIRGFAVSAEECTAQTELFYRTLVNNYTVLLFVIYNDFSYTYERMLNVESLNFGTADQNVFEN